MVDLYTKGSKYKHLYNLSKKYYRSMLISYSILLYIPGKVHSRLESSSYSIKRHCFLPSYYPKESERCAICLKDIY